LSQSFNGRLQEILRTHLYRLKVTKAPPILSAALCTELSGGYPHFLLAQPIASVAAVVPHYPPRLSSGGRTWQGLLGFQPFRSFLEEIDESRRADREV